MNRPVFLLPSLYDAAVEAGIYMRGYKKVQLIPITPDETEFDPEDDEDILDPEGEPDSFPDEEGED